MKPVLASSTLGEIRKKNVLFGINNCLQKMFFVIFMYWLWQIHFCPSSRNDFCAQRLGITASLALITAEPGTESQSLQGSKSKAAIGPSRATRLCPVLASH